MKSNRLHLLLLVPAVLAAGCASPLGGARPGPDPEPTATPSPSPYGEYLSPAQHLVRISMALRGQRPSAEDLDLVLADPDALFAIVDRYLDEPAFGRTVRDLHAETFLVRAEINTFTFPVLAPLAGIGGAKVFESVMEQPLRQIEYVVMNDRPYTEIVTGEYAIADGIYSTVWGVPHSGPASEWRVTQWGDGRPAAGILSSSTLALRFDSPGANYNRARANAFSRALICFDFLAADIVVDGTVDLSDPAAVQQAVRNNPTCKTCHDTLDPFASFFFGVTKSINPGKTTQFPVTGVYAQSNESDWQTTNERRPSFFGRDGDRLDDLGRFIAQDPRFSACAARRFHSFLHKMPLDAVPQPEVDALDAAFIASGYDAKALAREVVLSDSFRRALSESDAEAATLVGLKRASPEQIASMFEDLAGFRWVSDTGVNVRGTPWGPVELLRSDVVGYRSLSGGIDSYYVVEPSGTVNTMAILALDGIAARAAGVVVEGDFAVEPASRRLLRDVAADETEEGPVRLQLARIHLRLFGEPVAADSPEIDAAWSLFRSTLERTGDGRHAWKTTLTGLFSDLRIAYY